ncbi:MAG: membrane protein insertase YidC [Acidobacteria bacterium]|nr:membrane protein insertase YidC [Acidobacteriota bacterium]
MEKRVFLAILLSFAVLAGYQAMFPPVRPVPAGPDGSAVTTEGAAAGAATAPAVPAPVAATPQPAALVADVAAREIVVETDAVRAVFNTAGATLQSWQLKGYLENGTPLELLPADVPADLPRPFTMSTADAALSRTLATALYRPSAEQLNLGSEPGQLTFEYRDESGLNVRKTFYFQPEGKPYLLRVEAAVDQGGASRPVTVSSGVGIGPGLAEGGFYHVQVRAVHHLAGDVEHISADDRGSQSKFEGDLLFAGIDDQYFLFAVMPGSERVSVQYRAVPMPAPTPEGQARALMAFDVAAAGPFALPYYLGPKEFDTLRAVDTRLELVRAIDFGFFAPIVVPLLIALKWVHGFVGNWGWAIIVLTILINVIIFPLRHRSMVSMKKMQALQPEVKAIQERYAKYKVTDPERQKMNQEMMALYKQKGVNPVAGCIPMLLTMPVLFAFYSMLSASIELRGAPFVGWITDLSRHDPWYVTPVLMGLSMLWQQKMMPTTADPIQQKVFLLMPVIFTFSFLWAPSGLVLYWFASNLLAIGQQYLTNRMIAAPAAVPGRSAAARRVRSGRTNGPSQS